MEAIIILKMPLTDLDDNYICTYTRRSNVFPHFISKPLLFFPIQLHIIKLEKLAVLCNMPTFGFEI